MKTFFWTFATLFISQQTMAQDHRKEDSLTCVWINNLAKSQNIPCEKLLVIEGDTIKKIMIARNTRYLELPELSLQAINPCNSTLSEDEIRKNLLKTIVPIEE